MKKRMIKAAKRALTVCLCLLITFGSIPLSGFVGLELPEFPEINFGFLKASAATQVLSEDGEFYISSINTSNKTASFAGVVDETASFNDDFYHIPNKTKYNDEIYIITGIADYAFKESGIKKVSIHSDITKIGDSAFRDCTSLTTVSFDERTDEKPLKIGSYTFSGCTSLESINLEDTNVTTIGNSCFYGCEKLQTVILPATATEISASAFENCSSLSELDLKNVQTIGMSAFAGTALTTVTIPATVTAIETRAFSGCKLIFVIFEANSQLSSIGQYAFMETSITEIAIPVTVRRIDSSAFRECTSLTTVSFDERTEENTLTIDSYAFWGCSSLESINLEDTNVATIGNSCFYGCEKLQTVILPATATEISASAFENCSSLSELDFKNVQTIGMSAFAGTALTTVTIPATVTAIETRAFSGCKLTSVIFEANSQLSTIGQYAFMETSITEIVIPATVKRIDLSAFRECVSLGNVVFEKRTEEQSLTIDSYAFWGCSSLESINLEDTNVTTIGNSCFYGCEKLQTVILPATATEISGSAFQNCSSLSELDLKNVQTIGMSAFAGTALTTVTIPATVTAIETRAFSGCKLTSVIFEANNQLSTIGQYAFMETSITEIVIPATVKRIDSSAFRECVSLENVVFEKRTEEQSLTIDSYAFWGCSSLEHINLQDSNATTIDYSAFYGCASLSNVRLPETLKSLENDVFDKCGSIKLYMNTAEPEVIVKIIDEGWPFEIKETGIKDSEERNLDSDNNYYRLTQNLSSSKNGVSLTVNYDFKETVKNNVSNCNVSIKVPSTVAFNTSTVTVNGVEWADVTTKNNGTLLNINNVPASGMIEFKVIVTDASYFVSYAKIGYKLNDKSYNEVIGIINSINDMITINAPSETNKMEITVSGMASPDKEIELYVNGEYIKTVTASKTGTYSEILTLSVSGSAETFTVEARINNGKNIASAGVVYSNDAVMITSAKMIYKGQEYDLIANQGKLPVISWSAGSSFSFIIKVDNKDAVKAVYVVSQKAGGNNSLLCEYNEELDAYTATGFKGIVPSNLSVLCVTENNKDEIISQLNVDNISDDFKEKFDTDSFETEVVKNTLLEDKENGELIFKASVSAEEDFKFSIKNLPIDGITSEELLNEGYEKEQSEDETVIYSKLYEYEDGRVSRKVYREDNGKITKGFSEEISGIVDIYNFFAGTLGGDEIEFISDIKDVSELFFKKALSSSNIDGYIFKALLKNSTADILEVLESSSGLGGLYTGFALKVLSLGFCQYDDKEEYKTDVLFAVAYGVGFVVSMACPQISIPLNFALGFIELLPTLDAFLTSDFKFIIDPSGIVYEAVPSNTVEGATVTALWIPYDEEVPGFWNEDYPDISKAVVWNAEEYDQINPLKTLSDGSYSWEVPEGWWLVKAEKDGYETVYSEWMDIPPERFDVNLALVSNSAPEVDYVNVYENGIEIAFTQYMDIDSVTSENISILLNGKTVEGFFRPEKEESTADNNTSYASVFTFVPSSNINGSVDIEISDVKNYCGIKLDGEFSQRSNVVSKVESLSAEETVLTEINSDNKITVLAYPASAAAGKKAFVALSNDLIASVDCNEITLDKNGQGVINVHSELPGDVVISFAIENTSLTASATVIVGSAVKSDQTEESEVFTINWIVDGLSDEQHVEVGSAIIRPQNPSKDGYAFIGWTPDVPDIMPANDLTFTAVFEKSYICPDCGNEILGEEEINDHIAAESLKKISVKIKNNTGSKTISYGETLRLTANTSNIPADAKIFWYVDGVKKGEGTTFEVSPENGSVDVTVKVVDASGNNYAGADISDSQKVSVNSGFFQKLISFFKNLFGISRIVTQVFMVK